MKLLSLRTFIIAAGVLAAMTSLSGCTQASHDLPSLEGGITPTPRANIEAIAKTYYDCMMDS